MSLATSQANRLHRQRSAVTKTTQTKSAATSGLAVVIVTALFFLAFISLRASQQQAKVSEQSLEKLEREIKALESDLEHSRQATANNQSDLAREKVIRNELLGQKPGELILQIPERENAAGATTDSTAAVARPIEKWQELLFGLR